MRTTARLRRLGTAIRWRALIPALVVLVVALAVTFVLLDRPETETASSNGRGGQFGGTVATSVARAKDVTEAVRLSGTMAATDSAAVVSGLAGKVDEVYVKLGDEVKAGASIAHLASLTADNQPAAYSGPAAGTGNTVVAAAWTAATTTPSCGTPSPSPTPSTPKPTTPRPSATPSPSKSKTTRPSATPSRGRTQPPLPGGVDVPDITINPPDITVNPNIKLPSGGGLSEQTVTAPFAGKITQLAVTVGTPVATGTVLATVSGDGLEARVAASPAQAAQLSGHTGAGATVRSAVPDGSSTKATVSSIAPTANATTQQTSVVLTLSDDPAQFKPGDPVVVDVGWPNGTGVVVPTEAVIYADGKPAVFVVSDQIDPARLGIKLPANLPPGLLVGRVKLTPVELGVRNGDDQHISDGISDGDVVVTTGQTNLIDGVRVAILDTSASPTPSGTR